MESHSANGLRVQSHDRGLSWRDRLCSSLAPSRAFFDTIEMSLPSRRKCRRAGRGAIRSEVSALNNIYVMSNDLVNQHEIKTYRKKLCVKSRKLSRPRCCSEAPDTATIPLYARSRFSKDPSPAKA